MFKRSGKQQVRDGLGGFNNGCAVKRFAFQQFNFFLALFYIGDAAPAITCGKGGFQPPFAVREIGVHFVAQRRSVKRQVLFCKKLRKRNARKQPVVF